MASGTVLIGLALAILAFGAAAVYLFLARSRESSFWTSREAIRSCRG